MSGRSATLILATSMFVMGACGIVYEYVLSVLGNYLIGSSHEEIFVIIGLMMFAMGVGSVLQRRLRRNLIDWFLLLEVTLGLVGGFSAVAVHTLFAVSESYRVVLYALCMGIGILIGMEIPILIRINRRYASSLRTNLSHILSMDYSGALAGALLFAYVLLAHVSLARIGLLLGITNVAVGAVGLLLLRSHVVRRRTIGAFVAGAFVALGVGLVLSPDWTAWAEQRYFRDPIVHRETSTYQHIVLTRRGKRLNFYLNGHLQFSSIDEPIYHELLVHPAATIAHSRRRALILGGGDGLALRELLRYSDVEEVTLVDLDPAVTRLAANHPDLVRINEGSLRNARVVIESPKGVSPGPPMTVEVRSERATQRLQGQTYPVAEVRVINLDADLFLRTAPGPYDLVILDFPDPSRLELAKLFSREFYRQLRDRLAPRGLVALQATSPFHAKRVFLCIGETLRAAGFSAIPYHQNVPSFGEWGFYLASPQPDREEELLRALAFAPPIPVPTRFVTPAVLAASVVFGKGWLTSAVPVLPNTKLNPVLVEYYREAWRHY